MKKAKNKMSSLMKKLAVLGVLVTALTCPSPAQATLTVRISIDGGATFTDFTGTATRAEGSVTDLAGTNIDVIGRSNSTIASASDAQISQVQININGGGLADVLALVVAVSDTGFSKPTGLSTLTSSLSGTNAAAPVSGVGTFNSVVDYNNNLFGGVLVDGTVSGNTFSTGLQPFTITSSFQNTVAANTVAAPPFSMSNEFVIGALTIGSGAQFQLTGTSTLSNVPAPPALLLALTGLPVLGIGAWFRRRKGQIAG